MKYSDIADAPLMQSDNHIANNVEDTDIVNEDNSDNLIKDDQVNIVLSFIDQNGEDLIPNVPQVASADVPDQDTPEKYLTTNKYTLGRVINKPVYYRDTNIYKIREQ